MAERMQDTPEWVGRQRTVLDTMKSAIDAHKGPLTQALRESRERLTTIISCTPTSEARDAWTSAYLTVMLAEESMQAALKATLKLID